MRSLTLPDGTVVEVEASGNGNPPGSPSWMQHTNVSTVWFRRPGGEWLRSPHRSLHHTVRAVEAARSWADLISDSDTEG